MTTEIARFTPEQVAACDPRMSPIALVVLALARELYGYRWIKGPAYDYDGECESLDVLVPSDHSDTYQYPPTGVIPTTFFVGQWMTKYPAWGLEQRRHGHLTQWVTRNRYDPDGACARFIQYLAALSEIDASDPGSAARLMLTAPDEHWPRALLLCVREDAAGGEH